MKKFNKHIGSNFDDFLKEEGILEETQASAIKKVLAYQIMKEKKISKVEMAQIKSDKKLLEKLRSGHRDVKRLKGRLVG